MANFVCNHIGAGSREESSACYCLVEERETGSIVEGIQVLAVILKERKLQVALLSSVDTG